MAVPLLDLKPQFATIREEVLRAVERVERAHPALVGGLGLYAGMGPAGPFAHVDVRGLSARWNR